MRPILYYNPIVNNGRSIDIHIIPNPNTTYTGYMGIYSIEITHYNIMSYSSERLKNVITTN